MLNMHHLKYVFSMFLTKPDVFLKKCSFSAKNAV